MTEHMTIERLQILVDMPGGGVDFKACRNLIIEQLRRGDPHGARRTLRRWIDANPAGLPTISCQPGLQWIAGHPGTDFKKYGVVRPMDLMDIQRPILGNAEWAARFDGGQFGEAHGGGGRTLVPLLWSESHREKFACALFELAASTTLRESEVLPPDLAAEIGRVAAMRRVQEMDEKSRRAAVDAVRTRLGFGAGSGMGSLALDGTGLAWRMHNREAHLYRLVFYFAERICNFERPINVVTAYDNYIRAESETPAFQLLPKQLAYDLLIKTWLGEEPTDPQSRWAL